MIKAMTYKIGPLEKCHRLTVDSSTQNPKISIIEMNDYNNIASDSDSIEKDYASDSANSREDLTAKKEQRDESTRGQLTEVVVVSSKSGEVDTSKDSGHDQRSDRLSTSDSASTNESGFGTVDDEHETDEKIEDRDGHYPSLIEDDMNEIETINETKPSATPPPIIVYQPLQKSQPNQIPYVSDTSSSCPITTQSDTVGKYPQGIKLPSLHGPRQIIYELNKSTAKSTDDIANILNDNSSINSSDESSHDGSSCLRSLLGRLNKCYYGCFCCVPTSSSHAPLCCTWLSIFCCCCPLFGLVSMYLTRRSKKLKLSQKYAKAEKYSNYAEKLNIAALVCGVIFYAIAVFLITLVIFMYWRHNNTL